MSEPAVSAFDLASTCIHLSDGAAAVPVEAGADFWAKLGGRSDLQGGRLVVVTRESQDWPTWEMHPAGDEVVSLLSGAVDLVLQQAGAEQTVVLRGRSTVIVPRGVWHRAIVREPGEMLFITRGAGTQHRPV